MHLYKKLFALKHFIDIFNWIYAKFYSAPSSGSKRTSLSGSHRQISRSTKVFLDYPDTFSRLSGHFLDHTETFQIIHSLFRLSGHIFRMIRKLSRLPRHSSISSRLFLDYSDTFSRLSGYFLHRPENFQFMQTLFTSSWQFPVHANTLHIIWTFSKLSSK